MVPPMNLAWSAAAMLSSENLCLLGNDPTTGGLPDSARRKMRCEVPKLGPDRHTIVDCVIHELVLQSGKRCTCAHDVRRGTCYRGIAQVGRGRHSRALNNADGEGGRLVGRPKRPTDHCYRCGSRHWPVRRPRKRHTLCVHDPRMVLLHYMHEEPSHEGHHGARPAAHQAAHRGHYCASPGMDE